MAEERKILGREETIKWIRKTEKELFGIEPDLLTPEDIENIVAKHRLECEPCDFSFVEAGANAQLAKSQEVCPEINCPVCQGRGKSMSDRPDRTGCYYMALCLTCQGTGKAKSQEDRKHEDDSMKTHTDIINNLMDSIEKLTERNVELLTYLHDTGRHKSQEVCPELEGEIIKQMSLITAIGTSSASLEYVAKQIIALMESRNDAAGNQNVQIP